MHESITPLGVEEFSRLYISFHNLLFPDDRLDDSTLWDLIEESRLASSMYGVEFFGVSMEGGIVGLFSLLKRSSDVIDCKVEVVGEPPGEVLGDVIVNYLERNCSRPQVIVPAGLTATISRLEASGYKLHSRLARLAIDLKEFNLDNFRGYIERLSTEGFTFKPLSSVADRILDVVWLVNETNRDEPTGGMSYTMTVEELEYLLDQGRLVGDACYIAFKNGAFNSIVWILYRRIYVESPIDSFNSIVWILNQPANRSEDHLMLSIPLYGFILKGRLRYQLLFPLSIPLYGFTAVL